MTKRGIYNLISITSTAVTIALIYFTFIQGKEINSIENENQFLKEEVTKLNRQDSVFAVASNQVSKNHSSLVYEINRAMVYLCQQTGLEVDSLWKYLNDQRAQKVEQEKALLEKQRKDGAKTILESDSMLVNFADKFGVSVDSMRLFLQEQLK